MVHHLATRRESHEELRRTRRAGHRGPIGRLYVNGNAIGAKAAVRFLAEEEKTSTYVYQRDLVDGGGAAPDEPMPPEKLSFDLVEAARSGGGAQAAPRVRMEDLELSELKDEP